MASGRFDRTVALPPGLTVRAIEQTVDYIERELTELVDLYFEQANVFSAIVGIFGIRGLDSFSVYVKSPHRHQAQQRFPDLCYRAGGPDPSPQHCLESKGSTRPWAVQSHYDHPGWYIVWRYLVDPTLSIEPKRAVVIWRVDVAFLDKTDWKYEGSTAGKAGGGRTHTFGLHRPAEKLRDKAVYRRGDIAIRAGKATLVNGTSGDRP